MSQSTKLLVRCIVMVLAGYLLRPQTSCAQSASRQPSDPRAVCAGDIEKLCAGVPAGGGRILACLKQHKDEVSKGCNRRSSAQWGDRAATQVPPLVPLRLQSSTTTRTVSRAR
jgi:Cysteine rich repeat